MTLIFAQSSVLVFGTAGSLVEKVFGGDTPQEPLALHQIAARALVVYMLGVLIVRSGKSRIMSRTTTLDVLLGFILGSLLSRGVTGHASISGTAVASVAMVALHWVLTAIACRSHWFGNFLKGHSKLIVKDGQVLRDMLHSSHISDHDLIEQLRLSGVDRLDKVREAHKERNGEISVIKKEPSPQVIVVAVHDGVQTVRIVLS